MKKLIKFGTYVTALCAFTTLLILNIHIDSDDRNNSKGNSVEFTTELNAKPLLLIPNVCGEKEYKFLAISTTEELLLESVFPNVNTLVMDGACCDYTYDVSIVGTSNGGYSYTCESGGEDRCPCCDDEQQLQ